MAPAQKTNNNTKKAATAAIAALMLATAGQGAAAAQLIGGGGGGAVTYWPDADAGCGNVHVQLRAKAEPAGWFSGHPTISGTTTVLNRERYSIPVRDVRVMVVPANSAVSPVFASCRGIDGMRIPPTPIGGNGSQGACQFSACLPSNGPSAGAKNWQQARAVVTLQNGAQCYSDMTRVYYDSNVWSDVAGSVARGVTNMVVDSVINSIFD
jgi:hypothetical protein